VQPVGGDRYPVAARRAVPRRHARDYRRLRRHRDGRRLWRHLDHRLGRHDLVDRLRHDLLDRLDRLLDHRRRTAHLDKRYLDNCPPPSAMREDSS
jgi:hypothetical protein